jgi:CDP-diacylglycerol--glycerol-3-phosphate 3-phosphatidyltransferase
MTLANQVTAARFVIGLIYFGVLVAGRQSGGTALMWVALGLFSVACFSDWLDGYLARRRGEETDFGRIADPFVDKIVICGSFILFMEHDRLREFVAGWMVVVIVAREFLVHGIRAVAEARGIKFGASLWGKQKMVLQCAAVIGVLGHGALFGDVAFYGLLLRSTIYLMLFSTLLSGAIYVYDARRILIGRGV